MKAKFVLFERSLKIIEDMEHSKKIGAVIIFCRDVPCKEVRGASFSFGGASERGETMDEFCEKPNQALCSSDQNY